MILKKAKKAAINIESLIANKTGNEEADKIIERIKNLKDYLVKKISLDLRWRWLGL